MKYLAAGVLHLAGVAWVINFATEPDDYYGNGTTHWEHASKDSAANYAVGAIAIASVISVTFLAMALVPRWRPSGFPILASLVYVISLYAGFFLLATGH